MTITLDRKELGYKKETFFSVGPGAMLGASWSRLLIYPSWRLSNCGGVRSRLKAFVELRTGNGLSARYIGRRPYGQIFRMPPWLPIARFLRWRKGASLKRANAGRLLWTTHAAYAFRGSGRGS